MRLRPFSDPGRPPSQVGKAPDRPLRIEPATIPSLSARASATARCDASPPGRGVSPTGGPDNEHITHYVAAGHLPTFLFTPLRGAHGIPVDAAFLTPTDSQCYRLSLDRNLLAHHQFARALCATRLVGRHCLVKPKTDVSNNHTPGAEHLPTESPRKVGRTTQ